jgi:CO dehydrogenase/acetyl-CoA synthase alpha subunit
MFKRVDTNHAAVVERLRANGWLVRSTAAIGHGFPDLIVTKHGLFPWCVLVEVKFEKGKLTADQTTFHATWPVVTVTSPEDAVAQLQCLFSRSTGRVLQISGEAA